jgi:Fe-S-cluster containining protein
MEPYRGFAEINGKKIFWETTFDKSVKLKCTHCGFSCTCSHVDLSEEDLRKIKEKGHDDFYQNYKKDNEEGFFIKGSDLGMCPFRKEGKCSIHEFKPAICALYPLKLAPVSKEKIYIDLTYGCKAILDNDFSQENTIDFSFIIKQNYPVLKFDFFGYPTFEKFYDSMKNMLEEELVLKKGWAGLILSLLRLNNLSEFWDLMNEFQKTQKEKYQKLEKNNIDNYLRDSIVSYMQKEFVASQFYDKSYLMNVSNVLRPYNTINWETNLPYYIKLSENKIEIIEGDDKKEIEINKIKIKNLSGKAKELLVDYFLKLWDRQTLWQFFCISFYTAKKANSNLSSLNSQIEIMKRKMLFLQFMMDIVAEKNSHEIIELSDAKEALMMTDLLFMQS